MKETDYEVIKNYMQECMKDTVHDKLHVSRVINYAVEIADKTPTANYDIVLVAATLHDIGRIDEQCNPAFCHAEIGSQKAVDFLMAKGYSKQFVRHVGDCILTHRYKKNLTPKSIEAKIVFDADKLDLIGAVGCARAILYGGQIGEPLYCVGDNGLPTKGELDEAPSLFKEYHSKLSSLSQKLYTSAAMDLAKAQQAVMNQYFESLIDEINENYKRGIEILKKGWE